ncbi:MAG: response regulator containing a CheY-like receiver domain and a GGDEF domain [Gammaproteobacteria bacterium]|nr:response regulator containing a CheY-like receiver domain and a GGDEF domain [Gammaproteobacteria bacterium]
MENFYQAADRKEAITVIDNKYFDQILTNYNMPEIDGKGLIDYIRNRSSQPAVPVLMVTTEGDMSKLATVEQSGVFAICDKPFEPQSIKKMIEATMAV